jgi:ATP:ADP antiporter, AAA family
MLAPLSAERLRHWLLSFVDIRPGEGARVALLFLYSMAAVGGVLTIGLAASDVLFMSEMPPTALPYMFILPAAAIIPVLLLYNQVAARMPLARAIIGSNLLLLVGIVLFRVLLDTAVSTSFALLAALFMFMEFAGTLITLQFWNVAGQVFNTREAKRLFGLIAAGGTLATPIAGLSLVGLVQLIGVPNLLWIAALSLVICIACVAALSRRQQVALAAQAAHPIPTHNLPKLRTMLHSPLLRAIGWLTIVLSLLINIGTYQFYQSLQQRFAEREADMAAYLGAFEFWAGMAAVLVQVALTSRIIRRFGIFVALLLFPLGMALGAGLSIVLGGVLWTITLIRAADPMFQTTINTAALNVLYIIVAGDASINIRGVGTVARRTARDCIGEMGLLSRQPRSADCVAITDITALRIERADFWEVLAEMPALALGVIDTLSQRLDEAVANLQNVRLKESNE